jgi:hypothetical protein
LNTCIPYNDTASLHSHHYRHLPAMILLAIGNGQRQPRLAERQLGAVPTLFRRGSRLGHDAAHLKAR